MTKRNSSEDRRVSLCFRWLTGFALIRCFPGGLRLAYVLSQGINAETGIFYASRETLAKKISVGDVKTITRLTGLLEKVGYITVKRDGGRKKANEYRLVFGASDRRATETRRENGRRNVPVSANRRLGNRDIFVPEPTQKCPTY